MLTVRRPGTRAAFALAFAALATLANTALATAPDLRDQAGAAFRLEGPHATPMVLTFVAAHCVDACPIINAQFSGMQNSVRRAHLRLRLVTLTLDPEHDRIADMRRLAMTFNADPRLWTLATGSPAVVHAIMRRFGVTASRGNREYDDIHTTFVYLLDTRGHVVKTMMASTNLQADLFAELQRNWNSLSV